MPYEIKFKWQNPNVKSNPKPQCQNVFQNDQLFTCKYSGWQFKVQGCFSFHQLNVNPWPRPGFPLLLRRNPWRRIQCDCFKNAYQVAPPDPVKVSGRGGQAWTIELWTRCSYIFFSICHLTFIWNLSFDLCHLNLFYLHLWTLLGSPFKPP